MGSFNIDAVLDPTTAQQAATKNYVDTMLAALNPYTSVYAATAGANIPGTYVPVAAGIGDTFTTTATGTFTVDGTTPPLGARILIKDQSSGYQNGVYTITTLGSIGVSTVFTRALDFDTPSDVNGGGLIPVLNGTVNALSSWQQVANVISIGPSGTALVFTEFTANPSLYLLKANNLSDVASASAAFINISPLTTAGDLIYEASGPTPARLSIGSTGQVLTVSGGLPIWASPATSGTVTNVSVVSANGLSGTVATSTTTPAITLVPTFTGIVYSNGSGFATAIAANFPTLNQNTTGTASNITGTSNSTLTTLSALSLPTSQLSGNISLTAQVSGVLPVVNGGTGISSGNSGGVLYFSSTGVIGSSNVLTSGQVVIGGGAGGAPGIISAGTQYQSLQMGVSTPTYNAIQLNQSAAVNGILPNGNTTAATGNGSNTIVLRDSNGNTQLNNLALNGGTTTSSGGTTVLVAASPMHRNVIGSTTQTVQLPSATTLNPFTSYYVTNQSTGAVTVTNDGGSTLQVMAANSTALFTLTDNTATNGIWSVEYVAPVSVTTLTSLGIFAGKTAIGSGVTSISPTFSTPYANSNYAITATLMNTTDSSVQFQPVTTTAQSTTGFTATWNMPTATANYILSWQAISNN
jgi:hypothetical protein